MVGHRIPGCRRALLSSPPTSRPTRSAPMPPVAWRPRHRHAVPLPACQNGRNTAVASGHSRTSRTAAILGMGWLTRFVKHSFKQPLRRPLMRKLVLPSQTVFLPGASTARVRPGGRHARAPPPVRPGGRQARAPPPVRPGGRQARAPPPVRPGRQRRAAPPPVRPGRRQARAPPPVRRPAEQSVDGYQFIISAW